MICEVCHDTKSSFLSMEVHKYWEHGIDSEKAYKEELMAEVQKVEQDARKLRREIKRGLYDNN